MKVRDVRPLYPLSASAAWIEGRVTLDARVAADGFVSDIMVRGDSHPDLADAAVEAVRQWQFTPTLLNCTPVDVSMTVNVTFEVR